MGGIVSGGRAAPPVDDPEALAARPAYAKGYEMHHRLAPQLWSVDEADLTEFTLLARKAQLAEKIPNTPHPATGAINPTHDDPSFGPSIHLVVKHLVRPTSEAAGGMSWSLTRHPEGLEANVFATHCWDEGAYEFYRKVMRYIRGDVAQLDPSADEPPPDPRPKGPRIWICFLANPQCWHPKDLKALLGSDPRQSPFAKALKAKGSDGKNLVKCMWVVSNHATSIYTRLWCVYELQLALELSLPLIFSLSVASFAHDPKAVRVMVPPQPLRVAGKDLGTFSLNDQLLMGFSGVAAAGCSDPEDGQLLRAATRRSASRLDATIERIAFANTFAMMRGFDRNGIKEKLGKDFNKLLEGIYVVAASSEANVQRLCLNSASDGDISEPGSATEPAESAEPVE